MTYRPVEEFQTEDHDHSSARIRDMPYGKQRHHLTLTPDALAFLDTRVGQSSAAQTVMLTNTGYDDLTIVSVKAVGNFAITGSAPTEILPGETAEIQVVFSPLSTGSLTGGLYIDTGNAGGQEFVSLTGSGLALDVTTLPLIRAENDGAGTPNSIAATTADPVPVTNGKVLIAVNVYETNTASPVTISFNNTEPLTIKDSQGNDLGVGELIPDQTILGYRLGDTFRYLVDEVGTSYYAHLQAQAERAETEADRAQGIADATRLEVIADAAETIQPMVDQAELHEAGAEDARDIAAGYASDAVSQGNVPIYATVAGMSALSVPVGINALRTNGYSAAGDGGGALYKRVASEPAHGGNFQSADSAWWELAEPLANVRVFGAKGINFLSDDQPAFQAAVDYAVAKRVPVYAPAGKYRLGAIGNQVYRADLTDDFKFYGDGPGATVIKRADGVLTGSFQTILYFRNAPGYSVGIDVSGFTIDGNGRGNGMPLLIGAVTGAFAVGETITTGAGLTARVTAVAPDRLSITNTSTGVFTSGDAITGGTSGATSTVSTTLNPYIWQQSHSLAIQPNGALGFHTVNADNIESIDPTADSIGVGGNSTNTVDKIMVSRIIARRRERLRSDLTITACWNKLVASDIDVASFEFEPNSIDTALKYETTLTNVITTESLDLYCTGAFTVGVKPKLVCSNVIASGFVNLGDFDALLTNVDFRLISPMRFIRGRWRINGGSIHAGYNGAAWTDPSAVFIGAGTSAPEKVRFESVEFSANPAATALAQYYNDDNASTATQEITEFIDCEFKGSQVRTAFVRSGKFRWQGCQHDFAGGSAILQSTANAAGVANEIHLKGNDVRSPTGFLYQPAEAGNEVKIWMRDNTASTLGNIVGFTRYDKINAPRGTGVQLTFLEVDDAEASAAPTTGRWVRGQRVWLTAPVAGGTMGYVCTTSGAAGTGAVFKAMPSLAA